MAVPKGRTKHCVRVFWKGGEGGGYDQAPIATEGCRGGGGEGALYLSVYVTINIDIMWVVPCGWLTATRYVSTQDADSPGRLWCTSRRA